MSAKYLLALLLFLVLAMPAMAQFNSNGGNSSPGTGLPLNMQPMAFGRLITLVIILIMAAFSWLIRQGTSGSGAASSAGSAATAGMWDRSAPAPTPMPRRHVALYSPTEIALATGRPLSEVPVNLPQGVHAVQHLKDKFRPKS